MTKQNLTELLALWFQQCIFSHVKRYDVSLSHILNVVFQDVLISLFLNSHFSIYSSDKCLLYSSVIDTKENSLPLTTLCMQHVHSIRHQPHHQ